MERNQDRILTLFEFEEAKEDIISAVNNDGCIGLHLWIKSIVEYRRLHLIRES